MLWIDGPKSDTPMVDINQRLREQFVGEITDEQAREFLGRYMQHHIGFMVNLLTGVILSSWQRILIKSWNLKNYTMTIASRGLGKSFIAGHFCYLYCLLNPGKQIIIVAPTFRSSRRILEHIDAWSRRRAFRGDPGGALLRETFARDMEKKQDNYVISFKNGSTIVALPLGDPDRLRGFRCSVLIIDEALMIPQVTIDNVLKPFLFAVPLEEANRRNRVRREEAILIKEGKMTEEQRESFDSQAKMILLSSASYAYQDLFQLFKKYLIKIKSRDPEYMNTVDQNAVKEEQFDKLDGKMASYCIHQLPWQIGDKDMIDKAALEELESGMLSESTVRREFGAQFVQDSDGYFRAIKMEACTIPNGKDPCVEIVGDPKARYVLAIDQNVSDSETADHFAMCVIKIVERTNSDGSKNEIGLVVHQYAEAGPPLKEHIFYLWYLLTHFNIVYIGYDSSQGKNLGFINICNESELFREKNITLKHINADFGTDREEDIVKQVRKGYNKDNRMIVQPQAFHSQFQTAANEHLQACFDNKRILFAAKALPNPDVFKAMQTQEVGAVLKVHSSFKNANPEAVSKGEPGLKDEFIEHQDILMDLVKTECALIEVKVSSLGHMSYDIPQHMKRNNKKISRVRRDSYSALLLGNWCLRIYLAAMNLPTEEDDSDCVPVLV